MTIQSIVVQDQIADAELVSRILKGEKKLFEIIIRRYNQRFYRIGMFVLGVDSDTEDAMQITYINAYEHLFQFENRSSLATWMTRIMMNQCYEQKRKKNRLSLSPEPSVNVTTMKNPANILMNKELSKALEQAIGQLPEKYRMVFVLREIEDMSVRETSATLNIEEANVKVRLNRAKTMLKENLNNYIKDHVYSFHLNRCDGMVNYVMNHLKIVL